MSIPPPGCFSAAVGVAKASVRFGREGKVERDTVWKWWGWLVTGLGESKHMGMVVVVVTVRWKKELLVLLAAATEAYVGVWR